MEAEMTDNRPRWLPAGFDFVKVNGIVLTWDYQHVPNGFYARLSETGIETMSASDDCVFTVGVEEPHK